jgi:preprotein translocase subunit SecA
MAEVYAAIREAVELLGMEAGVVGHDSEPQERRVAHCADITYGTVHEFGWEYLRDNLAWDLDSEVQRGRRFGVVCDAEQTLIGECLSPLGIIANTDDSDTADTDTGADAAARPILAEITIRGYLGTYDELAAATSGATPEAVEVYRQLYHLDVVPAQRPSFRSMDTATHSPPRSGERESTGLGAVDPLLLERRARYAEVLDEQSKLFYARRRDILGDDALRGRFQRLLDDVIDDRVAKHLLRGLDDLRELGESVKGLYPMSPDVSELFTSHDGRLPSRRTLIERVRADIHAAYQRRENELGSDILREVERRVLLAVADRGWRDHLAVMGRLRDELWTPGTGTVGVQTAYERRAAGLFNTTEASARAEAIELLFHLEIDLEGA